MTRDRVRCEAFGRIRRGPVLDLAAASEGAPDRFFEKVTSIVFSSDGARVILGAGRVVVEFDAKDARALRERELPGEIVAVAPGGSTVIRDGERALSLVRGDAEERVPLGGLDPEVWGWSRPGVVFATDADSVVWGYPREGSVKQLVAWDPRAGNAIFTHVQPGLCRIAPSSNGRRLAMSCEERDGRHTVLFTIDLDRDRTPTACARYEAEPVAPVRPRCVVAAANFEAAALTRLDGTRIVDLATGATRVTVPSCIGRNTAASRDLRVIATLARGVNDRHRLEVWSADDANAFHRVGQFDYEGSDAWLEAPLAVSPDGRTVAFTLGTSPGSRLALWDVKGAALRERWRLARTVVALEEIADRETIGVAGSPVRFDVHTLERLPDDAAALPLPTVSARMGDVQVRLDPHDGALVVTEGERERRVALRMGEHGVGGFEREHLEPYPETVFALYAKPPRAITCLTLAERTASISDRFGIVDERYEFTLLDLADPPVHRVFATWLDVAALSPDGTRLAYGRARSGLVILDSARLEVVREIPFPSRAVERGRTDPDIRAAAVALSHDRRWIAAAWRAVVVLWREGESEPADAVDLTAYADRVTALAFVERDRSLMVGTQRGLLLRFEMVG